MKKKNSLTVKKNSNRSILNKNLVTISLKDARVLKGLALEKAEEIGISISVTILDFTGNILLVERMEDAIIASIDISKNKAFTAFSLNENTHSLEKNEDLKNINLQKINGIPLCFLGGASPIKDSNNKVIGAIGISGGSVDEDISILKFALENWHSSI